MEYQHDTIQLSCNGRSFDFPLIEGSEKEKAIDIKTLRARTGLITLDQGYANTGSCTSSITFMDGEKGILRYRGIPIQELAKWASFKETAFLLIHGSLPTRDELTRFSGQLTDYSPVHENMKLFFQNFPPNAHPMGILSSMVNSLRSFYPEITNEDEEIKVTVTRLLSKIRTLAAMSYKISMGHQVVYPRPDLSYCANFLHMMFDSTVRPYELKDEVVHALRVIWILHADHEQNCSTSAVRLVGSARVNLYAAISSGITALWGPLHGGANQAVIEMLEAIGKRGSGCSHFVERAKNPDDPFRLMGFGHRVYKTYDPRAVIMKDICHKLLGALGREDALLDIAQELEKTALEDEYFISRNLYPNIDFYTGIAFRAMGIPTNMFPVMFAIGRLPGWIAQWLESIKDPHWKLSRPRQIYTGPGQTAYTPIEQRD